MRAEEGARVFHADEVPRSVHGGGRLATFTIVLEAWRRGLSIALLDGYPYRFEISDGETTVAFDRALPEETTNEAFMLAKDKYETLNRLKKSGVPTPNARLIRVEEVTPNDIRALAQEIGYPVVLKPASASKGRGVFTNIGDSSELLRYYSYLVNEAKDKELILESFFEGEDYRVQVVGGRVAGATWRRAARIVGDGKQTVRELIADKNRERRGNPALSKDPLKIDLEVDNYLSKQGYTYSSVPPVGAEVRLRGKANISTGGDLVDVTSWLPSDVCDAAIRSVAAIPGLVSAGVDVLIGDGSVEDAEPHVVIELNPRAHMGGHMFPSEGAGYNTAGVFVDHYFPASAERHVTDARRLSLRIDDILAPLREGSVRRIELTPPAAHGYPRRERVSFPAVPSLSPAACRRLTHEARRLGVVGSLQRREKMVRLTVAGEAVAIDSYLEYVARTLRSEPRRRAKWDGVVWHGFKVDPGNGRQSGGSTHAEPSPGGAGTAAQGERGFVAKALRRLRPRR